MAERDQTYRNHTRLLPPFHFFVIPVLLLNFLNELRHLWRYASEGAAFTVVVAAALLTLALLSRTQAVAVQDRVIRLEMRLRLRQVLPPELHPRINDLAARQLVALRFASDAELPELVREILDGKLRTGKEIKQRVKNWQSDWLRA
jgi:Family of unknown function (DUF6526)